MLKKMVSLVIVLLMCVSFWVPTNAVAAASTIQKANTIIVDMGSAKKKDIEALQHSHGKLFDKLANYMEKLKESGEVGENAQPVILIVKKKKNKPQYQEAEAS